MGCLLVIIASLAAIFLASTSLAVSPCSFILSYGAITVSLVCSFARAPVFTLFFMHSLLFALTALSPLSLAFCPLMCRQYLRKTFLPDFPPCLLCHYFSSHKFPLLLSISSISMSLLINLDFFFYSDSKAMSPHLPSRYRESFCYLSYSLPSWVSPLAGFFFFFFLNFFAFPLGHPCFYAGMLIVTVSQFLQWQETYRESPWVMGPSQICGAPWRLLLGSL